MIPVLIPTVQARESSMLDVIEQLNQNGFSAEGIWVEETPPDLEPGWKTHGVVSRGGLIHVTEKVPDFEAVLFIEDDVILSRALTPTMVRRLSTLNEVVTLYLAGLHQYQPEIAAMWPDFEGTVETMGLDSWYGSQALLLPPWMVAHIIARPEADVGALDYEVRDFLTAINRPMWVRIPNLVQHRAPASIDASRPGQHKSSWFVP